MHELSGHLFLSVRDINRNRETFFIDAWMHPCPAFRQERPLWLWKYSKKNLTMFSGWEHIAVHRCGGRKKKTGGWRSLEERLEIAGSKLGMAFMLQAWSLFVKCAAVNQPCTSALWPYTCLSRNSTTQWTCSPSYIDFSSSVSLISTYYCLLRHVKLIYHFFYLIPSVFL